MSFLLAIFCHPRFPKNETFVISVASFENLPVEGQTEPFVATQTCCASLVTRGFLKSPP
jgi:hypothetical protein